MDSKRIEELLNKYWNCETSLDEERELKEYFQGSEFPETLKGASALFKFFAEQKKKSLDDTSFDREVLSKVNAPKGGQVIRLFKNSMRIAAGIAVLMTAFWIVRNEIRKDTPQEIVDTYNDPQLAFEETKRALLMISKSFGKAEEQAKKINLLNEAQEKVQTGIADEKEKSRL